jgi:hypothetical protein
LAPWKESITQRGGMVMSVGGEAAPGRRGGTNWANMNLTMLKNEKKITRLIQLQQMNGEDFKHR